MNLSEYVEFLAKVQPVFNIRSFILITGASEEKLSLLGIGSNCVTTFQTTATLNDYAKNPTLPTHLANCLNKVWNEPTFCTVAVVQLEEEDIEDATYDFIEDATEIARVRWAPFNVVTCEHFCHVEGQEPDFHVDYSWVINLSPEILLNGQPTQIYPDYVMNIDSNVFRPTLVFSLKDNSIRYALPVAELVSKTPGWDYPDSSGLGSYKDYE